MTAGDVIVVNENTFGKKAVAFDGTDDYILADAHAVARVAANDTVGTYSTRIYAEEGGGTFLSAGDNDSATEYFQGYLGSLERNKLQLKIKLYHGGVLQFFIAESTHSITIKKWVHIGIVQDGVQPKLYVNGKPVQTTNAISTDLTMWYDELTGCDKFAIGILESNATHTSDFAGMISDVKYWNKDLTADEMYQDYTGHALSDDGTYLQLHLDMDGDVTDAGLGADDGTLTGHAYLAGEGSAWSRQVAANVTGHAAEVLNTIEKGKGHYETIIKRGD